MRRAALGALGGLVLAALLGSCSSGDGPADAEVVNRITDVDWRVVAYVDPDGDDEVVGRARRTILHFERARQRRAR